MAKTNVLFVTSECVPFIKTGGLADVCGSLPKYFDKSRYDVRVMMPKYACIPNAFFENAVLLTTFHTGFLYREQEISVYQLEREGVTFYFLDSAFYFGGSWPYDNVYNDIEKFSFFSRMVLSSLPLLSWKPEILHCHDWESALVPVYLNDYFQGDLFFHKMKTVVTVHNLRFQGVYNVPTVKAKTGLSDYYFTEDKLKHFENGNLLKGGLVYADRITTVSPTYAEEIKTPYYGEGLDGLVSAKAGKMVGILNGIDTETYNPKTDENVRFPFDETDFSEKKAANKRALQEELGLAIDPDAFLIGIVSRLTDQKGIDLIACVLEDILKLHVQLVVLGTGETQYEDLFRNAEQAHRASVKAEIRYSEALSRRIYAGTDAFLMPSKFEPCGLSQLLALRYGSLPIVRETGGLKDTVIPYNEYTGEGNGFSFANYNAHDMLHVVEYAEKIYRTDRKSFHAIVLSALKSDYSWNRSAVLYENLYAELISEKRKEESRKKGE